MTTGQQYGRKATLIIQRPDHLVKSTKERVPESNLDLSQFHFTFKTVQQDVESPSNCTVRVFNLSRDTVDGIIKTEYQKLVLQAGYENNYGVIFQGNIKAYKTGRIDAVTTYLDILAADGDEAYNYAILRQSLAAANTGAKDQVEAMVQSMKEHGVVLGKFVDPPSGGTNPRGKVLFGMGRVILRQFVRSIGSTWSISNGQVNIIPLESYLPGEAVVLSHLTGLVGIPEQTENGVKVRALLNPKIVVGGLIQIDQNSVNKQVQQSPEAAPVPFNSYTGIQLLASITSDGVYRVFVAEFSGDTRGQDWYVDITALSIDRSTDLVQVQ